MIQRRRFGLARIEPAVAVGGTDMKRILALSLLTTFLGGCVIVPLGHGYRDDGYSRGHGYHRGDGYHRGSGYYPGYGHRGYGYQDRGR